MFPIPMYLQNPVTEFLRTRGIRLKRRGEMPPGTVHPEFMLAAILEPNT